MTDRDLLHQHEIREVVRSAYQAIDSGGGRSVVDRIYAPEDIAGLPAGALEWALGVGDPVRHADPLPGEVVLDIGCGGGIDSLLAARRVGAGGRVIGLDMVGEMLERSRRHAAEAGVADRCQFVPGEMEAIPLPSGSVDVVIANGVINLSPRKARVLSEVSRVLRPGGRLAVADLLLEEELPPELTTSDAAWAG